MRRDDEGQPGTLASGSRRTRSGSQAALVWTVQDLLILVNEIAAVEGDWQNALSSHQKWTIIAENCTAVDVVRNANQCRRKWDALLAEYKLIKEWEGKSGCDYSYWSLGCERRRETGLPVDFDEEVYKTIDGFTKAHEQADTDPENDLEAVEIDEVENSSCKPKRVRRRLTHQRVIDEERKESGFEEEHRNQVSIVEDEEQILAAKLKDNTELIHAILSGDTPDNADELGDMKDDETLKIERVRCKADKLIACLGDLVENLEQLSDVLEES